MVATIRVPNTLRPLTGGVCEVEVDAARLGDALRFLTAAHPDLEERLFDADGDLWGFVNVFVEDTECRRLDGLSTALGAETVVSVVPAVAGG